MTERRHHRPLRPGAAHFDALPGGPDPAVLAEAAEMCATALVRGTGPGDDEMVSRLVRLADDEGLDTFATLWSQAPSDSMAGALWRLYALRSFVHAAPHQVAAEYAAGRAAVPAQEVIAGVVDPPGPDQVRDLVDNVLAGVAAADFADALFRAAAFAHVIAVGRRVLGDVDVRQAARLGVMAEQLHQAGRLELAGHLGPTR